MAELEADSVKDYNVLAHVSCVVTMTPLTKIHVWVHLLEISRRRCNTRAEGVYFDTAFPISEV